MDFLSDKLIKREKEGSLRSLSLFDGIDFWSNDYLGIARNQSAMAERRLVGSTGSRLISGNSVEAEGAEREIAHFFGAEAGLIFNSGYDANLGLLSSVPQRGDTIIYDELVHASMRDGIRLGLANSFSFAHNDLNDLERRLQMSNGRKFVAVESLYSMDGDFAPLQQISALCERFGGYLIVDEAHAGGIFGTDGTGLCDHAGISQRVFARIVTFGKAYGSHGAIVLGSEVLRDYLINFARSFIYTTALPPAHYRQLMDTVRRKLDTERQQLHANIHLFCELTGSKQHSPIQMISAETIEKCAQKASELNRAGFSIKAILPPTVPAGQQKLRICLHAFNTREEIEQLTSLLS